MGHGISCSRDGGEEHDLFRAVQLSDLDALETLLAVAADPELARRATTTYDRLSLLHIAAANGQLQVRSLASMLSVVYLSLAESQPLQL